MNEVDCVICGKKVYLNPFNLKTYDNKNGVYELHPCCKEVIKEIFKGESNGNKTVL